MSVIHKTATYSLLHHIGWCRMMYSCSKDIKDIGFYHWWTMAEWDNWSQKLRKYATLIPAIKASPWSGRQVSWVTGVLLVRRQAGRQGGQVGVGGAGGRWVGWQVAQRAAGGAQLLLFSNLPGFKCKMETNAKEYERVLNFWLLAPTTLCHWSERKQIGDSELPLNQIGAVNGYKVKISGKGSFQREWTIIWEGALNLPHVRKQPASDDSLQQSCVSQNFKQFSIIFI